MWDALRASPARGDRGVLPGTLPMRPAAIALDGARRSDALKEHRLRR
jgi:hypothetical protein